MDDKYRINRDLINGHFGVMTKISPVAWREIEKCAKAVTQAVKTLSEVAKNFQGPVIK